MEDFEPTVLEFYAAKGSIRNVLTLFAHKFGKIDDLIESKLNNIYDLDLLSDIIVKLFDSSSVNEFKSSLDEIIK
jgi:hypothetical protein